MQDIEIFSLNFLKSVNIFAMSTAEHKQRFQILCGTKEKSPSQQMQDTYSSESKSQLLFLKITKYISNIKCRTNLRLY